MTLKSEVRMYLKVGQFDVEKVTIPRSGKGIALAEYRGRVGVYFTNYPAGEERKKLVEKAETWLTMNGFDVVRDGETAFLVRRL